MSLLLLSQGMEVAVHELLGEEDPESTDAARQAASDAYEAKREALERRKKERHGGS